MKRSVSSGSTEVLYNQSSDLKHTEEQIMAIAYACGLDVEDVDSLTIDDLIGAIRTTYQGHSEGVSASVLASTSWIRNRSSHLVRQTRKLWWNRNIIKGIV